MDGVSFIFDLLILHIYIYHCFHRSCGQIMVVLLKCLFIHREGSCIHPQNTVGHVCLRVSETMEVLVALGPSSSSVQCGHTTSGVCSGPVVGGGEESLRQGFHRFKKKKNNNPKIP